MVYFNLNQRETSKFQFHRFTNETEEIKLASFLTVLPTGRPRMACHGGRVDLHVNQMTSHPQLSSWP